MKKVNHFEGQDGILRSWRDIELFYIDLLVTHTRRRQTPIIKLTNLLGGFRSPDVLRVINFLIKIFKRLITSNPDQLLRIVQRFDNLGYNSLIFNERQKKLTYFGSKLKGAFRYDDYRKTELVQLGKIMNVKSCLYCNSQYTLVVTQNHEEIAKFQFDHYFPKSKFPYLSLSLYNLIPVCASCNLSKSATVYRLNDFVHPFKNDFHVLTEFNIGNGELIRMRQGERVPENEINIHLTNGLIDSVFNYNSEFSLEGIYNRHKDIIQDIFLKAYAYGHGGREALLNIRDQNNARFFTDEDEILRILLANYHLSDDINKRPLTKFMQDIAHQAGLLH